MTAGLLVFRRRRHLLLLAGFTLAACGDDGGRGDQFATAGLGTQTTAAPTTADETGDPEMTSADGDSSPTDPDTGPMMTTAGDDTGPEDTIDAFRFTELVIRDPHFFGQTILGCIDMTDTTPLGADASVNGVFRVAMGGDDPMMADGLLDLSLILVFRPLEQGDGVAAEGEFANGSCTVPAESTECELSPGTPMYSSPYTNMPAGSTCLAPDATHLGGYSPAPRSTTGPCMFSGPATIRIVTTAFDLDLENTEIAAVYSGDPADGLINGSVRGFLSRAAAEATILPPELSSVVGKNNVAGLLAGHQDCCEPGRNDMDGDGWWMYADFSAVRVPWTD